MSITNHGSSVQHPDSVCYVSYWHIPGGYDYMAAEVRKRYFANVEEAEFLARRYGMPPEMAFVVMISADVS